jgi:hypothetical protein
MSQPSSEVMGDAYFVEPVRKSDRNINRAAEAAAVVSMLNSLVTKP